MSNLVRSDYAEEYVFQRLDIVTSNTSLLKQIIIKVNERINAHKQPLLDQLKYTEDNIKATQKNINKYLDLFDGDKITGKTLKNKLESLEEELVTLQNRRSDIKEQIEQPTIKEVSFDKVYHALKNFSKILPKISPEKQKHLLHSIISKITINTSNKIEERSIKDIELFFDTSLKNNDYVLTYGKVHPD
jgi:site-specific DNA recombinase